MVEPVVQPSNKGSIKGASVTDGCEVPTSVLSVLQITGYQGFAQRTRCQEPCVLATCQDALDNILDNIKMRPAKEDRPCPRPRV